MNRRPRARFRMYNVGCDCRRRTMYFSVLTAIIIGFSMATAQAEDICKAIALRDIPSVDNPDAILKAGTYQKAVTQYRLDKKTGIASFCAHGGSCYPVFLTVDGKKTEALRLENCTVEKKKDYEDDEEITYGIDVDRAKNSAADLRYDDLDNKLLD